MRNPFAFLDSESKDRTLLLLLLSILHKSGDSIELDLSDLTAIEDGASFHKYPSDSGTKLVLRYARKGAEAFFLPPEGEASQSRSPAKVRQSVTPTPNRHAIHDDVDLALREEEMAARSEDAQRRRRNQARAESGALPWTNRQ